MKSIEQMFDCNKEKKDKLLSYIDLVLEKNKSINLTAIKNREEAIIKHLIDSLEIIKLPGYIKAENIIDVGTGAGFPGALLAIISPEKEFILLDSTRKKLNVIKEIAEKLQINNITTIHARAEELAKKEEYKETFDLCVSRAVANLKTLSAWCLPFVKNEGTFISYKGENYQQEIDEATDTIKRFGANLESITKYPSEYKDISNHVLLTIRKMK